MMLVQTPFDFSHFGNELLKWIARDECKRALELKL